VTQTTLSPQQTHTGASWQSAEHRGSRIALGHVFSHTLLILGAVAMLLPFVWMLSTSVKPSDQLFTVPPTWLPHPFQWDNYAKAMGAGNFGRYALNSLLLGLSNLVTNVVLSALAGYAFARLRFPGRNFLFLLVLATLMVPYQVTIIPLFVIVRHIPLFGGNDLFGQGGIGWINSYWGLIVPGAVGAFGIFMLRQFFQTLPEELEDAARIDGASELRIFWQIMLPLATPAVATLSIFSFQAGWNSFLWPLLITTTDDMRTIQLGLSVFIQQYSTQWDQLMAATVVATLPVIIVFGFGQRLLVRSIAFTGIKA
jgi:multiple sugar transport system permease protein